MRFIFYSCRNFEPWDWRSSIEKGIGGSETSHVEMCWRLARRGHECISYVDLPEDQKSGAVWRGTTWYHRSEVDFSLPGIWVIYRAPSIVDEFDPDRTDQVKWLICQDYDYEREWTPSRVAGLDRIVPLCHWHLDMLLNKHPEFRDKLWVTRNAFKRELIEEVEAGGVPDRDLKRIMFASSPDRGLLTALKIFKRAKEYDPGLSFYATYGYNNLDKLIAHGLSEKATYSERASAIARQHDKDEVMALCEETGAKFLGRIPQDQLYREWFKTGLLVYITTFCVTGDTLVDMPRDYRRYPHGIPIRDLVGRSKFPVWCFNEEDGTFQLSPVRWVKKTRKNAEVWRVEFDTGTFLRATPDHKVLIKTTGEWVKIKDLKPGDALLHLGKHIQIQVGTQNGKRGRSWPMEHRLIAEYLYGPLDDGYHADHIDGDCWNNDPDNIQILTASEHAKKTFSGRTKTKRTLDGQIQKFKDWYASLPDDHIEKRRRLRGEGGKKFWESMNPDERASFIARRAESRKAKKAAQLQEFTNHKVVRVVPDGQEDVYDMLVDGPHNFVANGVVVHNCETGWITGLEAQAMGAIPIYTPISAQGENTQHGVPIFGSPDDPATIAEAAIWVAKLSKNPERQNLIREPMMADVRSKWDWEQFVWIKPGENWEEAAKEDLERKALPPKSNLDVFTNYGIADNDDEANCRTRWLHLEPGDVFYDVGAADGAWTVPASRKGATVYAFDPLISGTRLDEQVTAHGVADNVHVVEAVVGREQTLAAHKVFIGPGERSVPEITLDTFTMANAITKVGFIKVDVEGDELRVLEGATGILARDKPRLMIEVHVATVPGKHVTLKSVTDFLDWINVGYVYEPVSREYKGKPYVHLYAHVPEPVWEGPQSSVE